MKSSEEFMMSSENCKIKCLLPLQDLMKLRYVGLPLRGFREESTVMSHAYQLLPNLQELEINNWDDISNVCDLLYHNPQLYTVKFIYSK